ncbi:MAG: OB-fold nucleic acid binding domain-containing protein, partial [Arenicellales bacterium]|nr:OB-fold nucleic acid binding domain-containing protein [Arenicellales bacterium]
MSNTEHNEQVEQRRAKLAQLRDVGEPYPNDFRREHRATEIIARCGDLDQAELKEQECKVSVAGRLMTRRIMGKASFAHIRDETGDLQIYLQRETLP